MISSMKRVATNHGGARPGAGRKKSDSDSISVNWRISKKAKEWLKCRAKEQGVSIAVLLDMLVDNFVSLSKKS